MQQEPVFIERDSTNSSNSTDDDNSLKPASYQSSYSSNSTDSDPVKCYNKLKRQGSRSSIIPSEGEAAGGGTVATKDTKAGMIQCRLEKATTVFKASDRFWNLVAA